MSFCTNCGHPIDKDAKFCINCGDPITQDNNEPNKTFYDGEIRKCRNCGEIINSFSVYCPSCGCELRGTSAASSVQRLYKELNKSTSTQERAQIIRNFPIPNAKEDIIEFMILASTNISGEAEKDIFEAWVAKFEQAYHKAQMTLQDDSVFSQIQEIYTKTEKATSKARVVHNKKSAENVVSRFFKAMPNPIFAIVAVLLVIYNLIRLFSGQFAGIDIIMDAVILYATYKITANKGYQTKKTKVVNTPSTPSHNVPQAKIPFDYISGTSDYYAVVEARFRQAGFTNISTISLNDLTFGLVTKDGSVDEIVINGKEISSYFRRTFDADVPVLITYHSMRN